MKIGRRRYFAYGFNVEAVTFGLRCPDAVFLCAATLADHRFIIMDRGYATVIPEPGVTVRGVLYAISPADELALDDFEEVAQGAYRKIEHPVDAACGRMVPAMLYVGMSDRPGRPHPGYLETVIAAARAHAFDPAYVAELASWLPT